MEDEKWEDLEENFRQHFEPPQLEIEDEELSFDSGSSKFTVSRSGTVRASMPLHSFIAENFSEIKFGQDHIKVITKDIMYEFRI